MKPTIRTIGDDLRRATEQAEKVCLCCHARTSALAATCANCGEASWAALQPLGGEPKAADLPARAAASRTVSLQCLREVCAAAKDIGLDPHLDEEPEIVPIGGKNLTVFAKLSLTHPHHRSFDSSPRIVMIFANQYNADSTDGFVVGYVSMEPLQYERLWPLRFLRLHAVSADSIAEAISHLLSEAIFGDL